MAYFPDLAPYAYGHGLHPGVVHVGWLDNIHDFPRGSVDRGVIEKLRVLATRPVELYRGFHLCELCKEPQDISKAYLPHNLSVIDPQCDWAKWSAERRSNGEIRVVSEVTIFAAPVLVVHYIEVHGYLPPREFLKAVIERIP